MLVRGLFAVLLGWSLISAAADDNHVNLERFPKAFFAGGCFWCMQHPFDILPGVISTTVGFMGGTKENPSYKDVSSGATGHLETVQVLYDPAKVTYQQLLDVFWHNVDPKNGDGQFCDEGSQYRSAIFYTDDVQKHQAETSKLLLEQDRAFAGLIKTAIRPATTFFPAEAEHQQYYRKHSWLYKFYRFTCGRDRRLKAVWGSH